MAQVKKSLSEKKPDDVDVFTKNVQTFVKDVLANFKEYQPFCDESMQAAAQWHASVDEVG